MTAVIHIFENTPHHFINFMTFFCRQCSDNGKLQHCVYIPQSCRSHRQQLQQLGCDVHVFNDYRQLLQELSATSAKVPLIFHSMLSRRLWLELAKSKLVKRSHWICWGADLYQYVLQRLSWKMRVGKWLQAGVCRRMASVRTLNSGDAELLRRVLGRSKVDVLPYPLVNVKPLPVAPVPGQRLVRLLLGNSAAASNNHRELFAAVAHLRGQPVEMVVPLNYAGDKGYINQVIQLGQELLGAQFVPLTEMLSKRDYDALLASVDGAVFAHDRQQGLYVAYCMMLQGKKLYLKRNTTTFKNFVELGFTVSSLEELAVQNAATVVASETAVQQHNRQVFSRHFSEAALAPKWQTFFTSSVKLLS